MGTKECFGKSLNRGTIGVRNQQRNPADKIPRETWEKHFKELLNHKRRKIEHIYIPNEINTFESILDSIIKEKKLRDALSTVKIGKASGPD